MLFLGLGTGGRRVSSNRLIRCAFSCCSLEFAALSSVASFSSSSSVFSFFSTSVLSFLSLASLCCNVSTIF
uniref:Uncharacterized protein n=1 Tax=Arundo donax TaxID=35708 RepID=A0A0A9D2P6_ARUDO